MFVAQEVVDPQLLFRTTGGKGGPDILEIQFTDHPAICGIASYDHYPNPWPLILTVDTRPSELQQKVREVRQTIIEECGDDGVAELIAGPQSQPYIMNLAKGCRPRLIFRAFTNRWFPEHAIELPEVTGFTPVIYSMVDA